ncbi:YhcB family protein [Testudinibacter sp. TR-2022]|uniref:YhcB family protein n=1 Tax=Testudinibacter sp. TR-2022 TaxID=2585029 RepID=UPI001118D9C6|nr:DUF1043 family protein [Testudinibacter sp. TR-2022]TNH07391.1 DUF1043 family protein [Pasteurellaceae bacterium Phil11]TNH20941.1 DUF1043 family protein [Testudinibacter sp. TR-2022]TNH27838.1 DUF1043 family protein [Testudinibacter sp. TR-2022]
METAAVANNVWLIGTIGVVIGFILAYLFIRITSGSVKKQLKTESELKQVKTEVEQQKNKIEEHFAESAELLKSLAQDYQRLYQHLAKSSVALLPEATAKEIFAQDLLADKTAETFDENVASAVNESQNDEKAQPKDYSKGSSGLLKSKES